MKNSIYTTQVETGKDQDKAFIKGVGASAFFPFYYIIHLLQGLIYYVLTANNC